MVALVMTTFSTHHLPLFDAWQLMHPSICTLGPLFTLHNLFWCRIVLLVNIAEIILSWLCLRPVSCVPYPLLPVSLDCQFLIFPLTFSNVCLWNDQSKMNRPIIRKDIRRFLEHGKTTKVIFIDDILIQPQFPECHPNQHQFRGYIIKIVHVVQNEISVSNDEWSDLIG